MKILYLISLLFLAACSTPQTPTIVYQKAPPVKISEPASPRPINAKPVKVEVIDEQKAKEKLSAPSFVKFVGISFTDFRNLTFNINEATRYIESQRAVIDYYKSVISRLEKEKVVEQ